jgi:hypothetical protein
MMSTTKIHDGIGRRSGNHDPKETGGVKQATPANQSDVGELNPLTYSV